MWPYGRLGECEFHIVSVSLREAKFQCEEAEPVKTFPYFAN